MNTAPQETPDVAAVLALYDEHPISAEQILAKVKAEHGSLEGLTPVDLYPHDQDHYGGLAANDKLLDCADVRTGNRVLDLCAGLCGPARYAAAERGASMVALEFNPGRAAGAAHLNSVTGMGGHVCVVRGDAQALPFPNASFDAVLGQEAFLHIPDKAALLGGAYRVLRHGGRMAFTDWIAKPGLSDEDRTRLAKGIAAVDIGDEPGYRAGLAAAGFEGIEFEDLSGEWAVILTERLAMYERLREEAMSADGADPHASYVAVYRHFVELATGGMLGGMRFCARRPAPR